MKHGPVPAVSGRAALNITGDAMTTLSNLYHGNINPSENNHLQEREDYKKLLTLVSAAQEKVTATLTEEQRKLFDNYLMKTEELSVIIEEEIFKEGFSLAMKVMIETLN